MSKLINSMGERAKQIQEEMILLKELMDKNITRETYQFISDDIWVDVDGWTRVEIAQGAADIIIDVDHEGKRVSYTDSIHTEDNPFNSLNDFLNGVDVGAIGDEYNDPHSMYFKKITQ